MRSFRSQIGLRKPKKVSWAAIAVSITLLVYVNQGGDLARKLVYVDQKGNVMCKRSLNYNIGLRKPMR